MLLKRVGIDFQSIRFCEHGGSDARHAHESTRGGRRRSGARRGGACRWPPASRVRCRRPDRVRPTRSPPQWNATRWLPCTTRPVGPTGPTRPTGSAARPLGTWYGVETENGRVTKLDLCGPGGNNLRGTIPPELGNLTHARELRLSNNYLTGTIPSTLGNMTALVILRLSGNALSGPVPSELDNLSTLWELRLHRNQLTGELPRTLMNLPSLYRLRIEDNAGLCAPADGDFQAWLGTLDEFESDCGMPAQARAGSLYRPMLVSTAAHGPLGFAAAGPGAYEAARWLHAFTTSPTSGQGRERNGLCELTGWSRRSRSPGAREGT